MNKEKKEVLKKITEILQSNVSHKNSTMDTTKLVDTSEKAINFLIELYFENLERFSESISDLKNIDLINTISEVEGAKITFEMSKDISDENRRYANISKIQSSLNNAIIALENKVIFYINKQYDIDNMNPLKRAFRGKSIITEIDSNNNLAKQALYALMAAISLQIKISKFFDDDIEKSIIKPYEYFKNKLLSGNTCLFMNDYDKDYSDGFWIKLSESMNTLNLAVEFIEKDEKIEDNSNLENVEFVF